MRPSYDEATLRAYFHPLSPSLWQDPVLGPLLQELELCDPLLLEAVADVDRSQVREALGWSPLRRLQTSWGMAGAIEELRGGLRR